MHTPVAFIIFNRPDTTERVFAEIARAKPKKLFVIADGPRADHPGDIEKCAAARAVLDRVDWECEVLKKYSDENLGCGKGPATGISWVFEQVDRAIILEDDCAPHPTFFRFCDELLETYRDDERVMMIGGTTVLSVRKRMLYSYHFSRLPTCFGGWATWRRAWQHHDMKIKLWSELRDKPWLFDILGDLGAAEFWRNTFDQVYARAGNGDYWDYQWTFACWAQNGLAVLANTNLLSNIGFREDATHTKSPNSIAANLPTAEMVFPLRHPPYVVRDREVDQIRIEQAPELRLALEQRRLYCRLRRKLSVVIPALLRKTISRLRSKLIEG